MESDDVLGLVVAFFGVVVGVVVVVVVVAVVVTRATAGVSTVFFLGGLIPEWQDSLTREIVGKIPFCSFAQHECFVVLLVGHVFFFSRVALHLY